MDAIILTAFLSALGSAASTSGIFIFIFKTWFEKTYEKKLETKIETHKAQLRMTNELQIADFKNKLELAAAERHVQYSQVFEKTAEIISETYGRLVALQNAADKYTQLLYDPNHGDSKNVLNRNLDEFWR